ncbi:putative secreted protein (Por secretion system target) [Algoriphagus aquaeductus]|uniref:Putative secreted protein (Por secretion system target) n=1 Tax=Algoriphagus aquaeductus TaxID=475299 RepID=A0A326RSG3_9BACT|nr:putative secreted protein (Por secretion system target) [Algoriphagus aquaeductus]
MIYGLSFSQSTTINSNTTVNASSIPVGNNIIMDSGATLNMDVSRMFGSLTVQNNNSNNIADATIAGIGTSQFTTVVLNASANGNSNRDRGIRLVVSDVAYLRCETLTLSGNRSHLINILGTIELTGLGEPIQSIGWTSFQIGPASTFIYSGLDQTIYNDDYHHLTLSNSGTKTFQSGTSAISGNLTLTGSATSSAILGLSVGGNLSILSNATFNAGSFNLQIEGNWTQSGTFVSGTSTVQFTGNSSKSIQVTGSGGFHHLSILGSGTVSALSNLSVLGNLTIAAGASFEAGNFTHQVGRDWNQSGNFLPGNSLVQFTGSNSGTIQVTGTGGFQNLSFLGSGTKTISSTLSVSGNITPVSGPVVLTGANTLTLQANREMEITPTGSLSTSSGRLILQPGSQYINRSTSNPTLEMRQTFTGQKGWRMVGTPVSTTYSNLTAGLETQGFPGSSNPSLQPNLLWWDETDKGTTLQGWRQPTSLSANVPAGRGHYFYVFNGDSKPGGGNYADVLPRNIAVTGTEVNLASGVFDFGLTFTPRTSNSTQVSGTWTEVNQADEGFNLVANPTASVIDFHASSGWNKSNVDQTIYIWDPTEGDFLTWNGTTGSLGNGRIAPFQAFWVKSNAPAPILQLTGNGAKSLLSTSFSGRKSTSSPPVLELNVAGEGMRAQSFITFGPDGMEGADPKDAYQLESLGEDWLLLYSFGSLQTKSPLVINHQPDLSAGQNRIIPLHLSASRKGEGFKGAYLMNWKLPEDWDPGLEIVLMDHIHKKAIDMKKEAFYTFELEAPKSPISNSRKTWDGLATPQAVIFQTPYELGESEELDGHQLNARTTSSSKPKRPFTLYIGAFPQGEVEYLPDLPKLFPPSPNPFSQETKIKFFLPYEETTELGIYDLLGQKVGGFSPQKYLPGMHEVEWIPAAIDLPKGIYVIRLATSIGQFTQKLIKN